MGRKFHISSWILSLAGACLGAWIAGTSIDQVSGTWEHILWSGLFFLLVYVGGFSGLQLSLSFSRRWQIRRARGWIASFLASGLLLFVVGAGGQGLFMLSVRDAAITAHPVDMVLLLDASGSMDNSGYSVSRTEAASQFVGALEEDSCLQAMSFASTVLDSTPLLPMDDSGKQTALEFIRAIDSVGQTDFNAPLSQALNTLSSQARPDSNRAILLLTDGEGDLEAGIADQLVAQDIRIFSVRIDSALSPSDQARGLIDLAARSGGFDTQLKPAADGSVDAAALLAAFQDAFQASAENRLHMEEALLVSSVHTSWYQFVVRLATLVLCAVLFGTGYFAQLRLPMILRNSVAGAGTAVLITLLKHAMGGCMLLICIGLAAAYVSLEWGGGDVVDV